MTITSKTRYTNLKMEDLIVNKENKLVIDYFQDYKINVEQKINDCENVILTGSVGVGKTYIIRAFINDLKEQLVERENLMWVAGQGEIKTVDKDFVKAEYILMFDLINELRKEYKNEPVDRKFFTCDVLIIDEVGVQFSTDAERQILFRLINYRYENFKPTILISNYPIRSTETEKGLYFILGNRIMDRINDSHCKQFVLQGKTMR